MLRNKNKIKQAAKLRRQLRTRAKIVGTATKPRFNVSKSLNYIYLQLIDDQKGKTLVSVHSKTLKSKGTKTEMATLAGATLATKALEQKINACVFDRGSAGYHGRIKAAAEGARKNGLKF